MAVYGYDKEIQPYATSVISGNENQNGIEEIPQEILRIRAQEARSLYLASQGQNNFITHEMEFTFMTNLLYQENRPEVVDFIRAEAKAYRSKQAEAIRQGLSDLVTFYEEKAKVSEESARYLSEMF